MYVIARNAKKKKKNNVPAHIIFSGNDDYHFLHFHVFEL